MSSSSGKPREWTVATLVVVAATLVSTWPLPTSPWLVPAHQDPLFSSWRLYQWARNLAGSGPGGLFDGNIFAPASRVLLYSDAIPLLAVPSAPFIWLGVPPLLVYAGLVWLSFLCAGLAMYACARELTASRFGALVAAVIFVAAPSRIEHVMHLELLWTAFLPLTVLGTVRLLRGEARGAWLTGVSLGAQFLCCIYYGVFMITVWPVVAGIEWLRTRPPLTRAVVLRAVAWLTAAGVVAGAYALPYQRARAIVGDRADDEVDRYSATLESYATFPPSNLLWGWSERERPEDAERRLSVGVVASALAVSAVLAPSAPWTLALTAGALVAVDASHRQVRLDLPPAAAVASIPRLASAGPVRGGRAAVRGAAGGDWLRQPGASSGRLAAGAAGGRCAPGNARRRVRQRAPGAGDAAPRSPCLPLAQPAAADGHRSRAVAATRRAAG